ncbi:SMODS domain-containing nucleotidyltransferase [Mycobacterium adipatum]|uniref:SMODS domain-containing nucleotidyltransferase n=1 Tax=Mycobacterium adipatum TaxID=1682113 RepID=UPI000A837C3C|nr:hypothetical protein [Mycobacterium adipatum]
MAATTVQAFNEFKEKLRLTDAQKDLVKGRRSSAASYLGDAFPTTSDLPLASSYLMGSAGRDTIIRPLDDVDVLAVFTNKDDIFNKIYRYDSQKFLYRVRDAISNYKVEVVGARGQAVRLFYKSQPHVDIAPVFKWSSGGYGLPNGSGGWLTTDPYAHSAWIAQRHKDLDYRLKPMVRMLKRWNNVHSKYLKGFHLEVMIATLFSSLSGDSRDACEKFFQWAQYNLTVADPAGHGGDLSSYLTLANRASVLSNLEASRTRAVNANAAEADGDHKEAVRLWRIVFGSEFPSFG